MTILELSHIALWVLAILIAPLCIALVYLLATIQQRADSLLDHAAKALPIKEGDVFPAFVTQDLTSGIELDTTDLLNGNQRIFIAVQSGCASCTALTSELRTWSPQEIARFGIVFVCFSSELDCKAHYQSIGSIPVLKGGYGSRLLAEAGTPTVFVVSADGRVTSVQVGPNSMRSIVERYPPEESREDVAISSIVSADGAA